MYALSKPVEALLLVRSLVDILVGFFFTQQGAGAGHVTSNLEFGKNIQVVVMNLFRKLPSTKSTMTSHCSRSGGSRGPGKKPKTHQAALLPVFETNPAEGFLFCQQAKDLATRNRTLPSRVTSRGRRRDSSLLICVDTYVHSYQVFYAAILTHRTTLWVLVKSLQRGEQHRMQKRLKPFDSCHLSNQRGKGDNNNHGNTNKLRQLSFEGHPSASST